MVAGSKKQPISLLTLLRYARHVARNAAGTTPPFHEIGEYPFQELCRDLFIYEPGIATCDIYGVRGQAQYGIDLLAHRSGENEIEVSQCKCYSSFSPIKIRAASTEFFDYWHHWSKETVKKFILFVACELNHQKHQEEILNQKRRFASYGLRYEVWSANTIRNRLRPHRSIVANYFSPDEHWVRVICGGEITFPAAFDPSTRTPVLIETTIVTQLGFLTTRVAEGIEKQIESMRLAWREGRRSQISHELKKIKNDKAVWDFLPGETRAKVLRFEASWVLETANDIDQAKQLADQAKNLDPKQNQARLQALIALRETGPDAALRWLDAETDIDSMNLKAALLLQMGRVQDAIALLNPQGE